VFYQKPRVATPRLCPFAYFDKVSPTATYLASFQSIDAADDEQASFGACQPHIQSPPVPEKSYIATSVVPDGREYNDFLLSSFKAVYGFDLDIGKLHGSMIAQDFFEPFPVLGISVKKPGQ
jgi:hypothetical protein